MRLIHKRAPGRQEKKRGRGRKQRQLKTQKGELSSHPLTTSSRSVIPKSIIHLHIVKTVPAAVVESHHRYERWQGQLRPSE